MEAPPVELAFSESAGVKVVVTSIGHAAFDFGVSSETLFSSVCNIVTLGGADNEALSPCKDSLNDSV